MGADTIIDADKVDDLLEAARYEDIDDIRSLVSDGVSLESRDSQGLTALHMAAANGHMTIVEYLINQGVDINALNDENNTPLREILFEQESSALGMLEWSRRGGEEIDLGRSYSMPIEPRAPMDEAIGAGKLEIIDAINVTVAQMELENTNVT